MSFLNEFSKKALLNSLNGYDVLNIYEDERRATFNSSTFIIYFKHKGFIHTAMLSTAKYDKNDKSNSFDLESFSQICMLSFEKTVRHIDLRLEFFDRDMLEDYLNDIYKFISISIQSTINVSNFFNFFNKHISITGRNFENRIKNMLTNKVCPIEIYYSLLSELGVDIDIYEKKLRQLS